MRTTPKRLAAATPVLALPVLALALSVGAATPAQAHWPDNDWRWRQSHNHHHWQPRHYHEGRYNPPPRPYEPRTYYRGW